LWPEDFPGHTQIHRKFFGAKGKGQKNYFIKGEPEKILGEADGLGNYFCCGGEVTCRVSGMSGSDNV
jgi:hypothetical protein